MKRLFILLIFCSIFLINLTCAKMFIVDLKENQGTSFSFNETNYEITLHYIHLEKVKININNNVTDTLREGDLVKLPNSSYYLSIFDIFEDSGIPKARIIVGNSKIGSYSLNEGGKVRIDDPLGVYDVRINHIDLNGATLKINGRDTGIVNEGDIFKIYDTNYFLIKSVLYNGKESQNGSVSFIVIFDLNSEYVNENCIDTDGGKNEFTNGLTVFNKSKNYDSCSGEMLNEFYCNYDRSKNIEYLSEIDIECPENFSCISGECISTIKNEKPTNIKIVNETTNQLSDLIIPCESGCIVDGECLFSGKRTEKEYCSYNRSMIFQSESNSKCNNDFECESNVCASNQCVSGGLFAGVVKLFRWIF